MPPRMSMFITNNNLPRVPAQYYATYNAQVNQGRVTGLQTMAFKSPMIDRIANSKPSCGACGKH
jgi:hypothetical protein